MKMKKKICITGSAGFIGSALVKWLHKKYNIIGIDKVHPPKDLLNIKNYIHYQYDITKRLPNEEDIYAVIHLAARPGVRDSHELFAEVCSDNIVGTQKVIDKCITSWKPKKLLISSSSSVYGDNGKDGHALKEDESVSPRSPYAMSKVAGEQLVTTYKNCGMLEGIDIASLRFFTVYGPNQRNELAIRAFTDWILRDKPIILYGDGLVKRDFTHIDDICSGIEELLRWKNFKHDVYNIGSGRNISIGKIIQMICEYTGKDVTINYQARNPYDVDCTKADISRIYEDTSNYLISGKFKGGWKPKIKFEDGLKEQIEWQKKNLKLD